jgi:PPM family protein phosphatase
MPLLRWKRPMKEQPTKTDMPAQGRYVRPTPPPKLAVDSYGLTDRGLVRSDNEDQFLIADLTKRMSICQGSLSEPTQLTGDEAGRLFIVADGMGGHRGGRVASALALRTVEHFLLNILQWPFRLPGSEGAQLLLEDFQEALTHAHKVIREQAAREPEVAGMGTTMTLALALHSDLFLAHVGDSRCYILRDTALSQVTKDHTLAAEMVRHGLLPGEGAAPHRLRHVLTNVLGGADRGVQVEVQRLPLGAGDTLLLCSDGLTELLSNNQIAAFLTDCSSARQACEQLVSAANHAGGTDNVSVIVARFRGEESDGG